ncbi:hypothetical protein BC628DRAFT_954797 [Trametes gibbosa]|nr:hypothetical protein BC628DRAFT_954797 [Trametes gibbosa]
MEGQLGKRVRESVGSADENSPPKRIKSSPAAVASASTTHRESPEFYYSDGNVVLMVKDVKFKLHQSRLVAHCGIFRRQWGSQASEKGHEGVLNVNDVADNSTLSHGDNKPGAELCQKLKGFSATEFTLFLKAFETPSMLTTHTPQQDTIISLLRVAAKLECPAVRDIAKARLQQLWPLTVPSPGAKTKSLSLTFAIIHAARKYHLPELLRRAFYELIRKPSFWDRVSSDRANVDLSDADLLILFSVRHILQQKWRALVSTEPSPGKPCLRYEARPNAKQCRYATISTERVASWGSYFIASGDFENGAIDPICHVDVVLDSAHFNPTGTNRSWCDLCLNERRKAWETAKGQWWDMLDGLFNINLHGAQTGESV